MKNTILKKSLLLLATTGFLFSCSKDLNRSPINTTTDAVAFSTSLGYKQGLAKVYSAFATTGSSGSGSGDIAGIDAGTSDFIRLYWNAEELPTDEAVCIWNDPGVPDFHNNNWTSNNLILLGLYNRSIYQITLANSFINESSDDNLSARGITGSDATNVRYYRAEARFLRAYQYWVLMDMFGNPPFVTEATPIGKTLPPQISRADLFTYIESELKAIDPLLVAPAKNEYARVDQGADWALLSRMYLNAQVYTGTARNTDAITYASKVIAAGYSLNPVYKNLFLADNNVNNPEVILPIAYDLVNTQNYGGTTFIINSSVSGAEGPANFGVPGGGWSGNHTTEALPNIFGDYSGATDKRAMFYTTAPTTKNTTDVTSFTSGFAVTKFSNLTSTGATLPGASVYCSTDFPLFRLGEVYLNYAEAVLRGGTGGTTTQALQYFNALRTRAYGGPSGNVTTITLNDVLNERSRELYWEATRRTDLIRFGKFTGGSYLWPFKGGVLSGTAIPDFRALYPLPATDVTANPNLKQNTGY
ncbi:putative outer membrane starch-binding protein [Mucilaginibacter gracilis]|uniref:Putative outer membrane starch-binding protein n=1 Tax=Mucilaginibacter gracilis TaxID=423350 RepID=A0A495J5B6_9SPHI|nr:RagB/SusD family nutrient uptake outer membrane protein [Mucilaginibacter gracilis]RKR83554.1 putative outer membrane starch-binding protein [Mucilaginibacter gracilis]